MANPLRRASRKISGLPAASKSVTPGQLLGMHERAQPMYSDWSTEKAVREGYAKSTWVYAAVRRITQAASSVPWVATVDGEDEPEHPLTTLLHRPNPYLSGQDLIERVTGHLYLGGNAVLTKIGSGRGLRRRGDVAELWPISPDAVEPIPSERGLIGSYRVIPRDGSERPDIRAADVVHMMFTDPGNEYWGMAPLKAVASVVDTDVEAIRYNRMALANRAVVDGALSTDQQLTDEQYERLNSQIRNRYAGSENARRTLLLEAGLSWQQMSLTPAEMDFIQSRRMTREEILAVFGVPPGMVGIVQSATQSDIGQMRRQFWLDTVIPYIRDLESAFDISLCPEYGPGVSVRPMLETVDAIQADRGQLVDQAVKLFAMGVDMVEINRVLELGLDEERLSDVGYLAANIVPASQAGQAALNPAGVSGGGNSLAAAIAGLNGDSANGDGNGDF